MLIALFLAVFLPHIPGEVLEDADGGGQNCDCGCGSSAGRCCCAALSASSLAWRCAGQDDPNAAGELATGGAVFAPPECVELPSPLLSVEHRVEPEPRFAGLDPQPEIPPPRA